MRSVKVLAVVMIGVCGCLLAACNGGGGGGTGDMEIVSININPTNPAAGSIVQLTATYSGISSSAGLIKNWTVSTGTVTATKPDFGLVLRQTAKAASVSSLSTTSQTVYWITPNTAGQATIDLLVEGKTKQRTATITATPVSMSVTDGEGGTKICTISVTNATDLYQAAFRVSYSSAWRPTAADAGDFLGDANSILWLGLINQSGFVPCAITKRGDVPGNDGTGVLARITFAATGTSAARNPAALPFELGLVMLRTSKDEPIALD